MNELVIALDVGGTNTRARIAVVNGGGEPLLAAPDVTSRNASARELHVFVSQVVRSADGLGTVTAAVVAAAGPVTGEHSRITNWPSDSSIAVVDLEHAGLPSGRTQMLNDATVGAWGALARVSGVGAPTRAHPLTAHDGELAAGNVVYVAPGTGLSSATIVRHGLGPFGATVLSSEYENTQMPRFEGEIGLVADAIAGALGRAPDWEDLVSGRGLARIHEALRSIAGIEPMSVSDDDAHRAEAIADAARGGGDEQALTAIGVFYRTLGHFAQSLALTCLPCAAVVVGGASTERNLGLLRTSGIAETFATHRRFGDLLGAVPFYAVGGEVNLEGAVWLATRAR